MEKNGLQQKNKILQKNFLTRKKLINEFIKLKKEKNKENWGYSSNNILENSFNFDPKLNRKERDSSNTLVNRVTVEKESNKRRSCSNCINSKNGTCSGLGKPCEDYNSS